MYTGRLVLLTTSVLVLAAGAASAAIVEDWGDTTDIWGGAISYDGTRVQIDTANNELLRTSTASSNTQSSYYAGAGSSGSSPPSLSHWMNFDGNTAVRFTFTNTSAVDQVWQESATQSGHPDDYVGFCFQRYDNSLEENVVRWYLRNLLGTVAAGESVVLTLGLDSYDHIDRSGASNMYGWDSANGRIRLGGWFVRMDYTSYASHSPYKISAIELVVPEPATVALLGVGIAALAARRRRQQR
jgi:hypothetical protein